MKKIQKLLQNDHWIMPFLRQQKSGLFWSIFLSFMTTFAAGALMFVSGFLISRSAQHPENILIIYVPIVLTRAFGIARPVFRYAQRLVSHNWVLRIVSKTRRRLYESVASTAGSIRGRMQTGDILSLLADDLDRLQNLYLRTLFPLGAGIMLYIFVSIGFGVVNWRFMLWWFFILAIILIVIPLLSLKWNYNGVRRQKALQNQLYTEATDAILGLQDWVLSGRQADLVSRQGKVMSELANVKNKSMKFGWWRDFIIQMLVLLLTITTLIWAGNQFANDRDLVNYIAAFTLAIFPLVDSFVGVNQGVSEASVYEDSMTRLNQLPAVKKIESAPIPKNTTVKFDKVTFAYDDKTIIDHLDLTIPTGEKIALLGRSGAGKTTILKLLAGDINPNQGEVTIGGQPVSQLQPKMSELVAVLDQQAYLFDSTILNNVRMGNIHASDEAVAAAIKQAGLQPLIDALPEGYHTQMREAGARFSGGEQQRFALARILLQAAPVVVLDEPTVSLDPKTEHDVLTQIFSVLQDRTIIWVTHHLTGIENVDKVYFLEAGKFVLSGKPSLLRDESERFKQLLLMDQY
ncbi:thiol reductant ABC exporter subunit CydC [Leuconostoc pseudomesenteroides]|jgi:ATP-binding cassette, subfamily C, bacterial CydC|uniref:thiol reductant ABC exporter subunit CydC n=1 Tax=Leuconostoc TaxID=1243 RepID=UPI0019077201|nr:MULTISPECIES: thiol reductant ABC exporter subunit CydC [Leuconostoc]MBK0039690.1 thiol reductant ABC exporter subunit CydC [Leuconostoc sp. S51]MBK0050649.1 thiol reductant ABC exporter subunit CydC [Leuconostoc sp. S50]MBS0957252.1 thiol reductant ABC exporter subunit CydC [Leuconostoc pseudomesenteroides]MCT4381081.1 thiol reductant ABC exporter subunit CydC [Leuconostoc pseudomesenteroides]MCT4412250.1 thiol reductant ABC exporter subunit CydC [Leuconostoc pseudomesenteroides]